VRFVSFFSNEIYQSSKFRLKVFVFDWLSSGATVPWHACIFVWWAE
jgi:hypothetical protein